MKNVSKLYASTTSQAWPGGLKMGHDNPLPINIYSRTSWIMYAI